MQVCIIGAGAIGGFLGPRLAQGHAAVSVVARGATLEAIRAHGWVLEHQGRRTTAQVRAVAPQEVATLGPQDVVFLTTKAYALADVAPLVPPLLGLGTLVVPVINGVPWWFPRDAGDPAARLQAVDPDGVLARSIPRQHLVGAVAYPSCHVPAPGVAQHVSGSRLVFGEIDPVGPATDPSRVERLVAWLVSAGFEAEATADIRAEVWRKLLGNACFNPVSMLTGSETDLLIDDPAIHRLFVAMMHEALAIGRAQGLALDIEPAARIAVTRKLGHVKTSMLQDAEAGKAVEIEAILGALVELGHRAGVPYPMLETVYAIARMRALKKPH